MIGRIDEEEQGEQLESQGIAQNGGDQVGAPLQGKLQLAAAPDIPFRQDPYAVPAGIAHHEACQERSDEERQDGGMQNHGALSLPVMQPSRISMTVSVSGES